MTDDPQTLADSILTRLRLKHGIERFDLPERVDQLGDLGASYGAAKELLGVFRHQVSAFAGKHGVDGVGRPGSGVKSGERLLEKARFGDRPTDILAAKFVVPGLEGAYALVAPVMDHFQVAAFKDRFVKPQRSGYRDLQFTVLLEDRHLAEVKVVVRKFDEVDAIEHRVYEIVRSLGAKAKLTQAEKTVLDDLVALSQRLYSECWKETLER